MYVDSCAQPCLIVVVSQDGPVYYLSANPDRAAYGGGERWVQSAHSP
jgi:hypothetical protein